MKKTTTLCLFTLTFLFMFAQIQVETLTPEFPGSGGVKIGPDGNIYIGNYGDALPNSNGTQVWKFNLDTEELTTFSTGHFGASGNDFDSQGNLFQSNIAGNFISKITPGGTSTLFTNTGISSPVGIAIDDFDNLYVCNCGNNTIRKVTSAGVSTLFSSGAIFNCPNGITIDHEGNLLVSNFSNGSIIKINLAGTPSLFSTIPGGNNGHLAFDDTDTSLIVASHGSSRIYRVQLPNGELSTIAGSGIRGNNDGTTSQAQFSRPNGVAISVTGDSVFINSSVPITNVGLPLNPSLLRMITGIKGTTVGIEDDFESTFEELNTFYSSPSNLLVVNFELKKATKIDLAIYSIDGKLILRESKELTPLGSHSMEVPIQLNTGLYLVTLLGNEQVLSHTFAVSK